MSRPPVLLGLVLLVAWLLLNGSLAVGQVLLACLLAGVLIGLSNRTRPLRPRVRNLHVAIRLVFVVLGDIVRSCLAVGRVVLRYSPRHVPASGFVDIPLELRDPHGLAFLAAIVTATPGTIWVALSPDAHTLRLHVLDLRDRQLCIDTIKQRYERPLIAIFQPEVRP